MHLELWWKSQKEKGPRSRRWEDNIKLDIREIEGNMDYIYLTEDRDQWSVLVKNGNELSGSIIFWKIFE
jgi:hypothetical protein